MKKGLSPWEGLKTGVCCPQLIHLGSSLDPWTMGALEIK